MHKTDTPASSGRSPLSPYVPDAKQLPEFTLYAFLLGIVLATVFNAANAYLGLKIGLTVSASIPSAVISMAVLRMIMPKLLRRNATVLENNIVHAIAATGEALAAAVIFTVPAIIFLGGKFTNGMVFWLGVTGGLMGILMMIPLRHALMVKEHGRLPFPEGTACAEVLIAGDKGGASAVPVFVGIGVSALFKFAMSGLKLFKETLFWSFPRLHMAGFGYEVSPLFIGVGYLVGVRIAGMMLAGGLFGYWVLIPLIHAFAGANVVAPGIIPVSDMTTQQIRGEYVRYIGAGGVAFGGLLSLVRSLPDIVESLKHSLRALTQGRGASAGKGGDAKLDKEHKHIVRAGAILGFLIALFALEGSLARRLGVGALGAVFGASLMSMLAAGAAKLSGRLERSEHDLSLAVVGLGTLAMIALIWLLPFFGLSLAEVLIVAGFSFFFIAVSARMVGLIGSTNQPVSGMTITALLMITMLFMWLGHEAGSVKTAAIMGGAIVCISIALSGDVSQDLKSAALLGATPWKVQLAQIMGTMASAVRSGFILLVLYAAYGLGAPTAEHPNPLEAPQAQLMAKLVEGVTGGSLPWTLLGLGAAIGLAVEVCGISALAFSIGLYLPITNWPMIMVGGLVHWWASRRRAGGAEHEDKGALFASGLIAGDALTGIALAVVTVAGLDKALTLRHPEAGGSPEVLLSTALYAVLVWMLAKNALRRKAA